MSIKVNGLEKWNNLFCSIYHRVAVLVSSLAVSSECARCYGYTLTIETTPPNHQNKINDSHNHRNYYSTFIFYYYNNTLSAFVAGDQYLRWGACSSIIIFIAMLVGVAIGVKSPVLLEAVCQAVP